MSKIVQPTSGLGGLRCFAALAQRLRRTGLPVRHCCKVGPQMQPDCCGCEGEARLQVAVAVAWAVHMRHCATIGE
jgi:hypothetical protein